MSADDHLGVAIEQSGQRRHGGPDPAVVRDAVAAVERHVEVVAHQYPLACDREVIDCLHNELSFDPTLKNGLRAVPRTPAPSLMRRLSGAQGRSPPLWGTFVGGALSREIGRSRPGTAQRPGQRGGDQCTAAE
jgi:hypothetical protein